MRVSRVLQLSILLVGLCLACHTPPPPSPLPLPGKPSSTQGTGHVPASHLKMLSLGLVHLLQGVEESTGRLRTQGEQVAVELTGATQALESLREQGLQTGRTHKQARKDLQILSARGDKLERVVQDLQQGLGALVIEQGALKYRLSRVFRGVQSVTQPVSGTETQLNMSLIKVIVDKQASRLANLASEVMAQDRIIDSHLLYIDHLEKQVSHISGGKTLHQNEGQTLTTAVAGKRLHESSSRLNQQVYILSAVRQPNVAKVVYQIFED